MIYIPEPPMIPRDRPPFEAVGRGSGFDCGARGVLYDEDSALELIDEDGTALTNE